MFIARHKRALAAAAVVALAAAGCGSSSKSSAGTSSSTSTTASSSGSSGTAGSSGSSGSGKTYTIGILTDVTGAGASGNKTSIQGVEAGIAWANTQGYHFKYVIGDTATSPTTALTAAQHLVESDHVFAVVADSSVTFGASTYLTSQHIPVIGVDQDANEWETAKNMFSVYGAIHTNEVDTTAGEFFKLEGATNVGTLGYSISPSSSEAAKAAAVSAQAVGLKAGYVNASFPFGGTNVQPVALAMKSAGIDAFTAEVDPNTGFALITALRQEGVNLKAALLPTGYGADLLQAGPGAIQAGQNVYFEIDYEPIEMHTPATEELAANLKSVGVTTDPGIAEYNGYVSMILLVDGLKGAGATPTQASLISSLSNIHNFNAGGLWGSRTLDINDRTNIIGGVDNCFWIAKLVGTSFQTVPGADPICGAAVPGKTVSASS